MTHADTLRLIRDRLEHVMHSKRSTQAWANELPAIHRIISEALEPSTVCPDSEWEVPS